jgi:hypothetical protein
MSRILGFSGFNNPRRNEGRREEEEFLDRCTTFF